MSLFKSLVKNLSHQVAGQRSWTPAEVRELIDRKNFDEARRALDRLTPELSDRDAVGQCLLGEVLFQQRDDEGAMRAFRKALALKPGMPSAHYGLSLLMAEADQLEHALRHAFYADSAEPNDARFAAQVGYCQLKLKNYVLAEVPLRRATLRAPGNAHVWNNLGLVLLTKGKTAEARECLERAVTLDPSLAVASDNLAHMVEQSDGSAAPALEAELVIDPETTGADPALLPVRRLEGEGALQAAIDACENLVLAFPDNPSFVLEANRLYGRVGDAASGSDVLQAYFSRHPDDRDVGAALGLVMLNTRRFREAETLLRAAVEAKPDDVDRIVALADAIGRQERYAEAGTWLDRARELAPDARSIGSTAAANLINQCRYDEALALCETLKSQGVYIHSLGTVLAYLGRFDEAAVAFAKSIEQHPNDPHIRFHLGAMQLLRLNFEEGWDGYRYRGFDNADSFRVLPFDLWEGQPLEGRKVLVLAEQGLGDQVMFASCLPDLLRLNPSEVVVEVINRIAPTIQRSFPDVQVVATDQGRKLDWLSEFPDIDYYVSLADLPGHFRRSLAAFPAQSTYLKAAPDRVLYWRAKLEEAGPGPYIGFSWKGGVESTRTALRSIGVLDFKPLAAARPGTWVCLQYGRVADKVTEARADGFEVAYWPEAISDLDEFAALVTALDLVVTVCNTTVHYAGATGRPVWVLAPKVPEWRYGLHNRVLPWYASSRVFRQHVAGEWEGVLGEVRQELSVWAGWAVSTSDGLHG